MKARALVQREMQPEQRPGVYLKPSSFLQESLRQLLAADHVLEGLVHVERAGDELPGAHGAAVGERDAGRAAAFDHDAVDRDLRLEACRRPR